LEVWREELTASARPWLAHEKERIAAVVAEIIRRLRAGQGTPPCLVHGDFHPENILVRGRSVTVIDFEHCAVADPASDLGYLIGQIDVQADRHWSAQGGRSPFDAESLKRVLLASYARTRPPTVSARVPLYQAWTYLKHLLYTLRMKGAEDPRLVTLWLDKAAACLETDRRAARQDAA
jgi:aminoglycoside phosphotransferase (APT) family kinase protein